jgi:hypothetical protein
MHFDELINQCIICLKTYNPSIEGPDSFVSKYLKKITKDSNERMFIKQVFYGVLRYKDFLKIFCENLFNSNPSSTERKDEYLYSIFAYLTIFRLDELPLDDYKQFVLFQDAVKMNEFLTFIFDEDVLKNKLREPWIKIYDFNYIDETIINGLLKTKNNIQDLIDFILNKAKIGNISSTKDNSIKNENEENINIETEKINKEENKIKNFLDIETAKELIEKTINNKFIEIQNNLLDAMMPKQEVKIDKKKEKKINENLKKFEDNINNIYKVQSKEISQNLLYDLKKITKALLIQSVDPLENGEKIFKSFTNNIKINDDNLEYIALKKLNIINEINNISKEIITANDDEFKKQFIDKYGITEKDIKDKKLDKYIKKYNRNENQIIEEILKKLKYI